MSEVGPKIGVPDEFNDGEYYGTGMRQIMRMLQSLVQANVIDVTLTAPPDGPSNGATYVVAPGATGAWADQDNSIAYWTTDDPDNPDGAWDFYAPLEGWLIFNVNDGKFYWFNTGTPAWEVAFTPGGGGGGGAALYDHAGNIPNGAGDNHIVVDSASTGYGQTTIDLTGAAAFSDASRYTVIAMISADNPAGTFYEVNSITKNSGSQFTVYSPNDLGGHVLFYIAAGLYQNPS